VTAGGALPDQLMEAIRWLLHAADAGILLYFFAINTSYLLLIVLASAEFARHVRRRPFAGYDEMDASPLTPPVSVIVPAYNEEAGVAEAVSAMLALRYPRFEVVVVDDGSTDATFERLRAEYDLVPVERVVPDEIPTRLAVLGVHVPRLSPIPLVVVRKENGGKTDALNVGLNLAQYPLVCMVDADSLLDPEALLAVAKPFCDDPLRVVATGGVVRVVNGSSVRAGRVVEARMPREWLPRIQVVEYLRAFLLGRTGWSRLGGLLVISGAFGLFRRDLLVEVGGLDDGCIGEDAELVVRLHRHLREQRRDYRIVFVAEPVSWSEIPATVGVLGRQRRRWHRGLTEILWKHRRMVGNPRYGRIGLLALPYYLVFELLAPLVELAGLALVPLGLFVGAVDMAFAWRFLLVAYGYALLLNLIALTVEEYSFHRYDRWQDLGTAVLASAAENLGYRQLTAWWRVRGSWAALRRRQQVWGVMTRQGFGGADTSASRNITQ
jgi:cellulose synthase/poly-beta-1,6-N-acetylglucosamine synthase-like glycosyltransferase